MMGYNTVVKYLILLLITQVTFASAPKNLDMYKKTFKSFASLKNHKIVDPIGEFKTNNKLLEALDKANKRLGFIREISTSTGCNDGCLPVIFTLFYGANGKFIKLISKPGLTKKNHEEFTDLDYLALESIIKRNPPIFKKVGHPTEMVDAITRATLKIYEPHVIKRAAYTTLRVNLYHQHTLEFIQKNHISPK